MVKLVAHPYKGGNSYSFYCPGCKHGHRFSVGIPGEPSWAFNGDMERPSFTPSLKNTMEPCPTVPEAVAWITTICHLVLVDGLIHFCSDCTHELSGQVVDLPEPPEDYAL